GFVHRRCARGVDRAAGRRRSARPRHGLSALHPGAVDDGGGEPGDGARRRAADHRLEGGARAARNLPKKMPFRVALALPVGTLPRGERKKTETRKQFYLDRRFLVLDEPTSTLTPSEAEEVLGLIRRITERGDITTVIITHKLKEVAAFADEVTVLRKG